MLTSRAGSAGHCVSFSYAISGLSADRLRVLLHPVDIRKVSLNNSTSQEDKRKIWLIFETLINLNLLKVTGSRVLLLPCFPVVSLFNIFFLSFD
jgi:hypothetical protein